MAHHPLRCTLALLLVMLAPAAARAQWTIAAGAVDERTVGAARFASSTALHVVWSPPAGQVDHFRIAATEAVAGHTVEATAAAAAREVVLAGLKAATEYTVLVRACANAVCTLSTVSPAAAATTSAEHWQLIGAGRSVDGLTRIVSDGNARLSATRFGPEAGTMANRVQLYYGPFGVGRNPLSTAATPGPVDAASPSSYLEFISRGAATGLWTPESPAPLVAQVATGQGVPLSASLGGAVRLFFEAQGADGRTRVLSLDSVDGYTGQDFNPGGSSLCATAADYMGGCAPAVVIGVDGDETRGNRGLRNARQFKLGWPTLDDWRWDGAPGRFMVVTTDQVAGCSTSAMNQAYAVWDGGAWHVQYDARACPKLFTSAQAAQPVHVGGARYKMYYGDPSLTSGRDPLSRLPFLGPKKLIYADGAVTATPGLVDFEDWEAQGSAREVVFLWPDGDVLDARAEGYIDDWHFLSPTGTLDLQVMYLTITDGAVLPFASAAVLLNP
ncbi:MAG: fibronectin type III domain-containing protein [Vicinamibacterales bacterium]|nr:fibronectin type III domain-containing protein [Vicinamibacterales bacterium]